MNWSELPSRQKRLYLIIGAIVVIVLGLAINNSRQAGADPSASGAKLDSGALDRAIAVQLKTIDSGNKVKAAFIDVFDAADNGTLGETDIKGLGTVQLPAGCYTVQATDKESPATGSTMLAVGGAAGCDATAKAVATANIEPITITMKAQ